MPENCDPINQDEVHYNDLFINSEYYEIDDVNRTTINFYSKACGDSLLMLHFNVKGGESSSQFRWFTIAKIEL